MSDSSSTIERAAAADGAPRKVIPADKPVWETPKIEDVSEQVMAQPYIRFT